MDPSLNRKIGLRITPWLARTGITPNQVTLLALASGLLAAWEFFRGPDHWLHGALWFQLSYILDNCDGALARLTGRSSGFGSWLDTGVDLLVHMAFFAGLGAAVARQNSGAVWMWVTCFTVAGVFFCYLGSFLRELRRRGSDALMHPDPPKGTEDSDFWSRLQVVMRTDFSFVVLAAALAGHMAWLLWSGLAGAFIYFASDLLRMVRPAGSRTGGGTGPLGG